KLSALAGRASGHGKPDRHRTPPLQRDCAGLQHVHQLVPEQYCRKLFGIHPQRCLLQDGRGSTAGSQSEFWRSANPATGTSAGEIELVIQKGRAFSSSMLSSRAGFLPRGICLCMAMEKADSSRQNRALVMTIHKSRLSPTNGSP